MALALETVAIAATVRKTVVGAPHFQAAIV
jgi:hypothetical protein